MKANVLFFVLVGCVLGLAAWLVYRNSPPEFDTPSSFAAQANEVPKKYHETVHNGLEYLVKNQHKDGHWEGDDGKHPVAMTGLVGLALLMERDASNERGEFIEEAKYLANIHRAADWLMNQSQAKRDGLIFSDHPSETSRYMEGHGLATLFLAGVCAYESNDERRKKLTNVLTRAVMYIVKAQSTRGGWYHTSKVEGHDFDAISTTVIQIQALQAAENAGIPIPGAVIGEAQEYLQKAMEKHEGKAKPAQNGSRSADTAAALVGSHGYLAAVSRGLVHEASDELRKKWLKYCETEVSVGRDLKFGRDELIHYYYAQAQCYRGGDTWAVYRTAMFDHLQSSQNKDGSWPAGDGLSVGPVYSTALWCTILQLDKRSHPSIRREPVVRL